MSSISSSGPSIQANQFAPASSQKSMPPNWENIGGNERAIALVGNRITDVERQLGGMAGVSPSPENVKVSNTEGDHERRKASAKGGVFAIMKDTVVKLSDNLNVPSGEVLMNGSRVKLTSDEYGKIAELVKEQKAELLDWLAKRMNIFNETAPSDDNSKPPSLEVLKSMSKELDALVSRQEEDRRKALYPNEV